jgi:hypothetical protein
MKLYLSGCGILAPFASYTTKPMFYSREVQDKAGGAFILCLQIMKKFIDHDRADVHFTICLLPEIRG